MATGVFVGVFLCSHVTATLLGRHHGLETDWSFAAGPTSLLDGIGIRDRLIPHYFFAVLFLAIHVGCGVRIVLRDWLRWKTIARARAEVPRYIRWSG
jgi:succinate dehydrogenase/fumarate reductase cytochrome b subunit